MAHGLGSVTKYIRKNHSTEKEENCTVIKDYLPPFQCRMFGFKTHFFLNYAKSGKNHKEL